MSTDVKPKKNRGPNWTSLEEEQLAEAWLHISQMEEFGTNQTGDCFYELVTSHLNKHTKFAARDMDQIRIW